MFKCFQSRDFLKQIKKLKDFTISLPKSDHIISFVEKV